MRGPAGPWRSPDSPVAMALKVFGSNGKICQRSDTGEVLDTKKFHHLVINTVTPEPTQTAQEAFAEVLWIVDISAPVEQWNSLAKRLDLFIIFYSFFISFLLSKGRGDLYEDLRGGHRPCLEGISEKRDEVEQLSAGRNSSAT